MKHIIKSVVAIIARFMKEFSFFCFVFRNLLFNDY